MKLRLLTLMIIVSAAIPSWSQTKEIYTNPEFNSLAKDHQVLAILPFEAVITLRPKQMREMTEAQLKQMQESEGKAVQSALESYFLKQRQKQKFVVEFQEISKTNAILSKNNINTSNIASYTSEELAQILEVDAIIHGRLSANKPMSDGASLALGVVTGFYGNTNSGKCTINIHDGTSGDLLWKYEKTLSRSLGSDTNTIINAMMRKASRKFPYIPK